MVEWYTNSAAGIEHGLTLAAPPAGADGSTVELTFALRGSLTPELDASGQGLHLKDANGETALLYDQLAVYDANGQSLPAHMRLAGCGPDRPAANCNMQLVIDAAGAAYPLTVDPLLHSQVAKLTASDAEDDDYFGYRWPSVGILPLSGRTRKTAWAATAGRPTSLSEIRTGRYYGRQLGPGEKADRRL